MTATSAYTSRRGFTLIEGLTVAGVIMLLLSLALVAATRAMRHAKIASERHHIASIKIGLEQFKRDYGLPPLVDDDPPLDTSTMQPRLFTNADLASRTGGGTVRDRYSIHSIPYYLMGLLDVEHNGKPADGAQGPAITKLQGSGEFSRRGAPISAVFTGGEDARRVHRTDNPGDIVYLDQWGIRSGVPKSHAIRYYRWETNSTTGDPNLPAAIGVAEDVGSGEWVIEDIELRSANYAIVSAGPDGLIDDENHDAAVNRDNIVEVGK